VSGYPAAYLAWQARDVARGPGLIAALVAGVFVLLVWRLPEAAVAAGGGVLLTGYLQQVGWPLVLVATGEVVRTDRSEGYYRFYFSRPVQPALFYLVRFLLGFVLVLAAVAAGALAVLARTGTLEVEPRVLGGLAITYLLLGGTVFFLSTVTTAGPRDWLAALLVHVFQNTTADLMANGVDLWPALRWLHAVLPPMHRLGPGLDAADALHAGLYGAGLLAASLLILDRRPLGGGARD
jgi:hypothetical protein